MLGHVMALTWEKPPNFPVVALDHPKMTDRASPEAINYTLLVLIARSLNGTTVANTQTPPEYTHTDI